MGALYAKDPSILTPIISGGRFQEQGKRGGTENVAGIVAFGKAAELSNNIECRRKIASLRIRFYEEILGAFYDTMGSDSPILTFNGMDVGAPSRILSITIEGINAESLVLAADLKGVCISAGSACQAHESNPSHVLKAIGLSNEQALETIRVSFSDDNTEEEITEAAHTLAECVQNLRRLSDGN